MLQTLFICKVLKIPKPPRNLKIAATPALNLRKQKISKIFLDKKTFYI